MWHYRLPRSESRSARGEVVTLRRRGAVAVAFGVAASVLAGCSTLVGGPAGFGDDGEGENILCVSLKPGDEILFGQVFEAPTDSDATIVEVTLDDQDGSALTQAMIMPIYPETGTYGIGSAHVNPDPVPPGWDERVPAAGAVVAAGTLADVVVQVERTSKATSGFDAIHVVYDVDHIRYEKSASTSYELKDSCL